MVRGVQTIKERTDMDRAAFFLGGVLAGFVTPAIVALNSDTDTEPKKPIINFFAGKDKSGCRSETTAEATAEPAAEAASA
jgi:hypothetical protein